MSEEFLDLNDNDLSSGSGLEIAKPKTGKKEKPKESGIDTKMMYDVLARKKTIRQYCGIKNKSENDLMLEIKMNIHWINSLLALDVPSSEITFDNIFGSHADYWISQVKAYKRTQEIDDLNPHERYVDYFKGLRIEDQKEHLRDLQSIVDRFQKS